MQLQQLLENEIKRSFNFFTDFTNLDLDSTGFGLTVDSTLDPQSASIASVGFALTAWVIACEHGYLNRKRAIEITRGALHTLLKNASHYRGFFAHFLDMHTAQRLRHCEYSTIDTALCLNGVITAAAYFHNSEISELAEQILARVDWNFLVFEKDRKTLFRMAYNPDRGGDYVRGDPGFIHSWNMAAEQKMMYLQAVRGVDAEIARKLYAGFSRDIGVFHDQKIIINPGGNLFAYQFSEAWLDTGRYFDVNGVDWFENTRLAALANRAFCMEHADQYKTYSSNSWGLSAGDSPKGYAVCGATPCLNKPYHDGTVSISAALACLPFVPQETAEMIQYLRQHQSQTWGQYGFFDAYNLAVTPSWYGSSIYSINKGCSMILIENYFSRLIWDIYTNSAEIQKALRILGFTRKIGG
jgi:hypothetical protein